MCFCFDGEGAVAAYQPKACGRLPAVNASASLPEPAEVFRGTSLAAAVRRREGFPAGSSIGSSCRVIGGDTRHVAGM